MQKRAKGLTSAGRGGAARAREPAYAEFHAAIELLQARAEDTARAIPLKKSGARSLCWLIRPAP